jgi:hypothetical protein
MKLHEAYVAIPTSLHEILDGTLLVFLLTTLCDALPKAFFLWLDSFGLVQAFSKLCDCDSKCVQMYKNIKTCDSNMCFTVTSSCVFLPEL